MAKVSVSKAWDETRRILSKEAKMLTAVALALLVLPTTIIGTLMPETLMGTATPNGRTFLIAAAVLLIGLVARITFARIALGPETTVGGAIGLALTRLGGALLAFALFFIPLSLLMAPAVLAVVKNPTAPPPAASLALLILTILAFVLGVRLLTMVIPAAAAQKLGPIALLKTSWRITKGSWWRLTAFVLLFVIGSTVASQAVTWVLGGALIVATGEVGALSIGALVLAAALGVVGAAFAVLFAVMLARMYVQLNGGTAPEAEITVPSSGT